MVAALKSTFYTPLSTSTNNMARSDTTDAIPSGTPTPYSHPTTPHPSRGQSDSPWPAPASKPSPSTRIPSLSQPLNEYMPRPQPPRPGSSTSGPPSQEPESSPSDQSESGAVRTAAALANLLRLDETLRDAEAYLRARDEFFGAWPSSAGKRVEIQEKAD
ncbi:hypothetical protein HDK77DRAFT_254223 [Phyllosticta capitalensis]|uniref:uncharacterized protein n=1 Tax=Phyllosticta capitalensis TaxID=121624 RepID=UPI0031323BBF